MIFQRRCISALFVACFGLSLASLSGCSVIPKREPLRTFDIPSPDHTVEARKESLDVTLRLSNFFAPAPLNEKAILVYPRGAEVQTYPGAQWSNRIPILLRNRLVGAARSMGTFKAVIDQKSEAASDFTLVGELAQFHLDTRDSEPHVTIEVSVQLIDSRSKHVIDARTFTVETPAPTHPVEPIINAFGKATSELAIELDQWIFRITKGR